MGWGAVWQAAWTQFGAEAVEIRLLILVAAAFFVLMILIGLRHAFRPAGPKTAAPKTIAPPPPAIVEPTTKPQPLQVSVPRAVRKSAKHTMNRQRALRPQIRRAPKAAEIDAPYSPLPPQG